MGASVLFSMSELHFFLQHTPHQVATLVANQADQRSHGSKLNIVRRREWGGGFSKQEVEQQKFHKADLGSFKLWYFILIGMHLFD